MFGKKTIARQLGCWMVRPPQVEVRVFLAGPGRLVLALLQVSILLGLLAIVAGASSPDLPMLQPPPNTHNAPITTTIIVNFSTSIDPSTVSTRTIVINSAQHGLVTGPYTVDNTQVQMTPAHPFFPGELVQGVVTTHTHALNDTALDVPVVWQFRTMVGTSKGTFLYRQSGLDSMWSEDIALGDLDGDGDLDIFLGHRDMASSVWFNDGSGHFTSSDIDLGNSFLIDVSLGDLDGDGDLDAILAGIQNNGLWWNNGHGTFSYGGELFTDSAIIRKVALGDLDADGDLDAVTVTACDPFDPDQSCDYAVNGIWWNNGAGVLQPSTQSLGHGTSADLSLGDLDNDGDLDAMVVRGQVPGGAIWMNQGDGVFTSTQTFDALLAASVTFGDLDGDGDLDAFVAPQGSTTSAIWLNDSHGTLTPGQYLEILGPVTISDLDGDGDLDAYSVNDGPDSVWLNRGDATFVFSGQYLGMSTSTRVALGDLDGDNDLDAVTSGYNSNPSLWINQLLFQTWLPFVNR